MHVWSFFPNNIFFWVYAGFVHFWHQHVVFLSICRFCALSAKSCIFSFSCRFWRVCNFEVNKAPIKNGFCFFLPFCFFWKTKIIKTKPIGCAKNPSNLRCFLSMSSNVFNTTRGKWYIPSPGRPWGGLPYIYICVYVYIQIYIHTWGTMYEFGDGTRPETLWKHLRRRAIRCTIYPPTHPAWRVVWYDSEPVSPRVFHCRVSSHEISAAVGWWKGAGEALK